MRANLNSEIARQCALFVEDAVSLADASYADEALDGLAALGGKASSIELLAAVLASNSKAITPDFVYSRLNLPADLGDFASEEGLRDVVRKMSLRVMSTVH